MNIKYWINTITQHRKTRILKAPTKHVRKTVALSLSLPYLSNYQETLAHQSFLFFLSPNSPFTISHTLAYSPTNSFNQENSFSPTIPHHQQHHQHLYKLRFPLITDFKRQSVSQHRHLSALVYLKVPHRKAGAALISFSGHNFVTGFLRQFFYKFFFGFCVLKTGQEKAPMS